MLALLTRSLPLFVAALALAAPLRADDSKPGAPPPMKKIENPTYTEWARFKVGAFVEMTNDSEVSGNKSSTKMTTKLLEMTAEKLVLETTMVSKMGDQEYALPASKQDVPKMLEVPDVKTPEPKPEEKPKVVEGSDTIDVAGKKVACKTTEIKYDNSGTKGWVKTWSTKEIPGGVARSESTSETKAGEMTISSKTTQTVTKYSQGG